MSTDAELTAPERESYCSTVAALDAEIVRLKALNWRMFDKRCADVARIARLRCRLARVLRLAKQDRDWAGVHDGAVWSRRVPQTPTKRTGQP